ncbi:hypothetical protein MBLNU457_4136t3 [Dothideomycetes sp. NU457]
MDPQSMAFQPQSQGDSWRLQNELTRLQAVQQDHAERLMQLERKNDDDVRVKSLWGGASPFPSVLSGTPQQTPLQHPQSDQFKTFDDDSHNMIGSLHLDTEEEPRRMGATSRANSVRFDESANQSHWSHAPRQSMDMMSRSGREYGGLPLSERASSHRSDGRASSVHSVRSAASGRASSINDTFEPGRSPLDTPLLAPGLLVLGTVPAIIRCWMNTNFKHNTLLYAAVCTGSHKSFIDRRMIEKLGFQDRIDTADDGTDTATLPVYLPEAVPHPTSSRSSSPAVQIPSLSVTFTVFETASDLADSPAIQIIIGSDTLRVHNADIFFSSNNLSIFDDDRNKLSIPLVRPEEERCFNVLRTVGGQSLPSTADVNVQATPTKDPPMINGLGQSTRSSADRLSSLASESPSWRKAAEPPREPTTADVGASDHEDSAGSRPPSRDSASRPSLMLGTKPDMTEGQQDDPRSNPARTGSAPAIWSNWRREGTGATQTSQTDFASPSRSRDAPYQRKDTGIKVLRPMKSSGRTFSATSMASPSPADGKSRFFDDGKRREDNSKASAETQSATTDAQAKEDQSSSSAGAGGKARSNPAGGASAFAWLKQGTVK